jgi:hypothetical protein
MTAARRVFCVLLALAFFGCERGPTTADARQHLARQYPDPEIVSVELGEDEVAAKTFTISVREGDQTAQAQVLYLRDQHEWVIPQETREVLERLSP